MCQKIAIFATGTSDSTIVLKRLLTYIVIALSYLSMEAIGYVPQLDVYGRVMESRGDLSLVPFRYQGQYEDTETGLYYNRFRYYSPQMGMYISSDPIGLAGNNPTLYGYVSDVNIWLDPWGLSDCKITQRLNELANEAVKEAKLSARQTASIQRSIDRASASTDPKIKAYHEMMAAKKEKMYMGTQIDTLFKKKVETDKMLKEAGIQTTPRGKFGPDVYTKDEYWDLTTETDWHKGTHQTKYDSEYGDGTGIYW